MICSMNRHGWVRRKTFEILKVNTFEFLKVNSVCSFVYKARFLYYMKVKRNLRCHDDTSRVLGHDYSLKAMLRGKTNHRMVKLIRPLTVIDRLTPDSRILCIGCRFETELLYLVGYGFDPRNIRGLDMISYSPWVDAGNMHAMPYPQNSWDAVLLSWVVSYSDDPKCMAREVVRVVRNRGVVAIGLSNYPQERLDQFVREGQIIGSGTTRIQTVQGLLDLFTPHVERIYFTHDVSDPTRGGHCMVIFSVKKD